MTGSAPQGEGTHPMGRASRGKSERRYGRTITVRNMLTGMLETFHNVRVDDAAVADWLEDRWTSVPAGNPNRPPDFDTPTVRGWTWRSGDPASHEGPPEREDELVAFYRTEDDLVGIVPGQGNGFVDREDLPEGFRSIPAVAFAKGSVVRAGAGFTGRAWLLVEFVGVVQREEARFATEAEARAWVLTTLGALNRGARVEEVDLGLDACGDAACAMDNGAPAARRRSA